jgi:predicted naringenin-chalcone synthase
MLGNALFADGAAALVLAASQADDASIYRLRDTGSCLLEESREAITWYIGDSGFDMSLSNRVPGIIAEQLAPWLAAWLDSKGHSIDTINSWAVHPGGPRILEAVDAALGFDSHTLSTSRAILSEYGNMSSPTVLFILERFLRENTSGPCVMLGFGPGLMAEVALLD